MYCGNCGAPNPDGAAHCGNCGAPLAPAGGGRTVSAPEQYQYQNQYRDQWQAKNAAPDRSKRKRTIVIAVAAVVLVAVIVVAGIFIFGIKRGYETKKEVAEAYVKAIFAEDYDAAIDLFPEDLIRYYAIEEDMKVGAYRRDSIDEIEEHVGHYADDFGKVKNVSVEIVDEDKYDRDYVDDINEQAEDEYDIDLDVSAASDLEIEVSYRMNGSRHSFTTTMSVARIDGRWYAANIDVDDFAEEFYWSY